MQRSNASLRNEASGLARELGQELPDDFMQMKNAELAALVDQLTTTKTPPTTDESTPIDATKPSMEVAQQAAQEAADADYRETNMNPKPIKGDSSALAVGGMPAPPTGKPTILFPLQVAPGRTISCTRRGTLRQNAQVRDGDFTEAVLATLIAKGAVIDSRATHGTSRNRGG